VDVRCRSHKIAAVKVTKIFHLPKRGSGYINYLAIPRHFLVAFILKVRCHEKENLAMEEGMNAGVKDTAGGKWVKGLCGICPAGCWAEVRLENGRLSDIRQDTQENGSQGYVPI
jgi:hypothetical protein